MKLNGEFTVPGSPQDVFDFFTTPERIIRCLPDLQKHEVHDRDHFTVTVKVGISHMKGPMTTKLEVVEKHPPRYARLVGKGSGLGSTVNTETAFTLEDTGGGQTRVKWEGEAKIGGRVAAIAGGLMEPVARANTERFIKAIEGALGGGG